MQYISTRGTSGYGFEQVLFSGLAPDGGLFVPEIWPRMFPDEYRRLESCLDKDYASFVSHLTWPFVAGALSRDDYDHLVAKAYELFDPVFPPLKDFSSTDFIMELYAGPSCSFKDYALQLTVRLFDYFLARENKRLVLLGATSGDTGSAAIAAAKHSPYVDIFMLHPYRRVSERQRLQMTKVRSKNVYNIAIRGDFDDCQRIVKTLFMNEELKKIMSLGAVNSINWSRIMAQIAYYFYAGMKIEELYGLKSYIFCVPTGNFGNIFSAYGARILGLRIERLIIALNINDNLARFLDYGSMRKTASKASLSPSMDITIASNFERLLFELSKRDSSFIGDIMSVLNSTGELKVDARILARIKKIFTAYSVDDDATILTIKEMYNRYGILVDPHTAVGIDSGMKLKRKLLGEDKALIYISTAHAGKFPDSIKEALGILPRLPKSMSFISDDIEERYEILPADSDKVMEYIIDNIRG